MIPDASACIQECIEAASAVLEDAAEEILPSCKGLRIIESRSIWVCLLVDGTLAEVSNANDGTPRVTVIDAQRVAERYGASRFEHSLRGALENLAKFDDGINKDNLAAISDRKAEKAKRPL